MNLEKRKNQRLFGFSFSKAASLQQVVDAILELAADEVRQLITPNASTSLYYNENENKELLDFYRNAAFILPDGMPIVWLGNLKGLGLHRLPGSDLFPLLWTEIKGRKKASVFVLARQELAEKLAVENGNCTFIVPPMFEAADREYIRSLANEVVSQVRERQASFVFLGLNFPKQELLGLEITNALNESAHAKPLILLLGASFEFYLKLKTRAPQWMQRTGLEWLYRFMKEPRRLWKRYTVDNFRFLLLAAKEYFRS
ncbi:MAG: WecB/TagA/CpsF family glycosyltransferase [Chitinophagaceae bacterium]